MYTIKQEPNLEINGKLTENIEIMDGVLNIKTEEQTLKYYDSRWNILGEDGKWYFLGFGAHPNISVNDNEILNSELKDRILCEETK